MYYGCLFLSHSPTRVLHVNNLSCCRKRLCEEFSGKWKYHLVFIKLIATANMFSYLLTGTASLVRGCACTFVLVDVGKNTQVALLRWFLAHYFHATKIAGIMAKVV